MRMIVTILCLLLTAANFQNDDNYKEVVKQFFAFLYQKSVSIDEFSSVYANASLDYDTGLFLRDSLGIQCYDFELTRKRDQSIDVKATPSYVFKNVRQNLEDITFGLTYDEVVNIIDNAVVSTQGLKFSEIIELRFPGEKRIFMELNKDTPTQVLWVWLNNATLLDDVINGSTNPQRLMLPGTINDSDGFVNIRKDPDVNSQIVDKFLEDDIFYYIPDNDVNWWQVAHVEDSRTIVGFIHKSRIINYNDMSVELKQKVFEKRNAE